MLLNYVVWDVDPYIFHIGSRPIAWYGLLWALVFIVGYYIMKNIYKKESMKEEQLDMLFMYMLISSVLGARLGHCLFYEPSYYLSNPIEILKVWEGGLASHGGAIGILIGLFIYAKKIKKPYIWILDRIVVPVAIGGAFIRFGNLMNSEIYGHETSLPWGFVFLQNGETVAKHPTQLYEALAYLCTGVILWCIYKYALPKIKEGLLLGIFFIGIFLSVILKLERKEGVPLDKIATIIWLVLMVAFLIAEASTVKLPPSTVTT